MCLTKINKYAHWNTIPLRLILAAVFLVMGIGKLADGGVGFTGMLQGLGFPAAPFLAWLVAIVEVLAGVLLLVGLFTRWASIAISIIMVVALFTVHVSQGFASSMVPLLVLAGAISLFLTGAGPVSLERAVWGKEF